MARWKQYNAFFRDYFTWMASGTLYIALVLSAMQVGLATEALGANKTFQSASCGFTVFSILGPIVVVALLLLQFCGIFLWNWFKAHRWRRMRYAELHPS